jgi:hypothetical protein
MGCAEPDGFKLRMGSREAERVRVFAVLDVRTETGNCAVVISDLSTTGARIEAQINQFRLGDVVSLRLPLLPAEQRAEIVWSAGTTAGIRFCASLDLMTFRLLPGRGGRPTRTRAQNLRRPRTKMSTFHLSPIPKEGWSGQRSPSVQHAARRVDGAALL